MEKKKRIALPLQIFIGLALGIIAGLCFMGAPEIAVDYIKPFGTIFLNLIKFIVVPIVFFSIISGVISMKDIRKVGSIGVKTVVYYLCTTAFAIVIGLVLANLFQGRVPGAGGLQPGIRGQGSAQPHGHHRCDLPQQHH